MPVRIKGKSFLCTDIKFINKPTGGGQGHLSTFIFSDEIAVLASNSEPLFEPALRLEPPQWQNYRHASFCCLERSSRVIGHRTKKEEVFGNHRRTPSLCPAN